MTTAADVVAVCVQDLAGPDRENAYHRLLELGEAALPYLTIALQLEANMAIRPTLVDVVWHTKSPKALPLLVQSLQDKNPLVWKTALDGLVSLGDGAALEALEDATHASDPEKLEWLEEAIDQVKERMADGSA